MARPSVAAAGEMISGLKSRFGFGGEVPEDEEFARYEGDFDNYDDFDDNYDDSRDEMDDYLEDNATEGAFKPATTSRSRFGTGSSTPQLVSADAVREHARSLISSRGSYEEAHRDRNRTGRRGDYDSYRPRENSNRSSGLSALFESSAKVGAVFNGMRGLAVIKPGAYEDVQTMATALRQGDAVVLAMAYTPEDLYRRILDFSFGVASAMDAVVDCIAPKVYVVACGDALNEDERSRLHNLGVL